MSEATDVETQARIDLFTRLWKQGMSAEDATKAVNRYLFDYGAKL